MATTKKVTSKQIITTLAHLGYKFRTNVLTDRIEVNGVYLTDIEWARIRTEARDQGMGNRSQVEDAVVTEAAKHPFHPIKDYLHSLLGWDGESHIDKLADFFRDTNGIFPVLLKKFLIGSMAKIFTDGEAQNPMLILDGRQNLGKSHFVWWLVPVALRLNFFNESAINPENKDDLIKLINVWIWEVTELGMTIRKADREALKAFITLRQVTVRKPYGREPLVKPALASFIGTINNEGGFLTDPTGHRRFRPVTLLDIDHSYAEQIYQDDIWAEAYARYLMGETYKLTKDELDLLTPVRERYELVDPMEEMLQKYFMIDPTREDWWLSSIEILNTLETYANLKGGPSKGNAMALGVAANKVGVEKFKNGKLNGYKGIMHKATIP